ncbi:restriction endonuclease subunit S [Myxococcaceae bacterium JPH2]|nr:restriction endonuclease subunit S [Myxococcaceae bacterium JPH2]
MKMTRLDDQTAFSLVSGLWKGERAPLLAACVIRGTNFRGDGLLDFSDAVDLDVESRYLEERRLHDEDIIIERSGGGPKQAVGRVALFTRPDARIYFTSNFTTAIRVIDRARFDPRYVALFLHACYLAGATESLQRATTGIRNLDWQEYLQFEIPEIDLSEQRVLSRLLDGVRTSLLAEERQVVLASDIKRAAMTTLFTRGLRGEEQKESEIGLVPESWNVVNFSEVREWLQYGTSIHCTLEKKRYPVLRIPNVEPGRVNGLQLKYCDLPDEEARKYLLQDGDLLFIRTNGVLERLGSCAVYSGIPSTALFASYLIRARLKPNVDSRYVAYFYASVLGTSLVAGRATPAADGKYNLNTGTIDSLPLPVPPSVDEQREIVGILEALDRMIDLHEQKRAVLDELFKSLLHKLLTATIRVDQLSALGVPSTREPEAAA